MDEMQESMQRLKAVPQPPSVGRSDSDASVLPALALASLAQGASADRRRSPRRRLETRVALKTEKAIFFMESLDISSTGIRVHSEVAIEVGTRCRLVPFFDDVSRLFEASGTIVRVNEVSAHGRTGHSVQSESTRAHMGIQFDTLSPAELEALLAIMSMSESAPALAVAVGSRA
jgi:hypothetical protein